MPQLLTKRLVDERIRAGRESEVADTRQPGLVLRCGVRSSVFQYVWSPAGKKRRIPLGVPGELGIDDARDLARSAADLVTQGLVPTEEWLRAARVVDAPLPDAKPLDVRRATWSFEEARDAFLAHVLQARKASTHRDYSDYLHRPELAKLRLRPVADISEEDLSEILATIHRSGREGTAEGMKRKLSSLWTFLQRQHNRSLSGVRKRVQLDVPDRTPGKRREKRFPVPSRLADVLKRARAGDFRIASRPLVLLVLTGQRRETVVSVSTDDVSDGVWHVPPLHRKTADRRDDTHVHTLPWPSELSVPRMGEWVFAGKRVRRGTGALPHVAGSTLTHALTKEGWSPHDARRSMTTTLRHLGYTVPQIALVLDHNEGGGTVIDEHYDAYQDLPVKREMLAAWKDVLEGRTKIDEDAVFKSRKPRKKTRRFGQARSVINPRAE